MILEGLADLGVKIYTPYGELREADDVADEALAQLRLEDPDYRDVVGPIIFGRAWEVLSRR